MNKVNDRSSGKFFEVQTPLIAAIEEKLQAGGKRTTIKDWCAAHDLSPMTIAALMGGHRWAGRIERETIAKLATALEIPVLHVYVLAGFMSSGDIIYHAKSGDIVEKVYQSMRKDSIVSFRAPSLVEWHGWPKSAKVSICLMYELMKTQALKNA